MFFILLRISEEIFNMIRSIKYSGPLAQSVEQRTFNPWVVGSIPTGPTIVSINVLLIY